MQTAETVGTILIRPLSHPGPRFLLSEQSGRPGGWKEEGVTGVCVNFSFASTLLQPEPRVSWHQTFMWCPDTREKLACGGQTTRSRSQRPAMQLAVSQPGKPRVLSTLPSRRARVPSTSNVPVPTAAPGGSTVDIPLLLARFRKVLRRAWAQGAQAR